MTLNRSNRCYFVPHTNDDDDVVELVVYFPGDVQYFQHQMLSTDHLALDDYAYEPVAHVWLPRVFPRAHVLIIVPSRMENATYSCFDHFVPNVSPSGVASSGYTSGHACAHLLALVTDLSRQQPTVRLRSLPWVVLGFSRGGIGTYILYES